MAADDPSQDAARADTAQNPFARRAIAASQLASMAVAASGAAVLLGWLLDVPGLTSLYLPGPTIKTNAAICLTCAALANVVLIARGRERRWRWTGCALAVVPAAVGALTLSEHLVGWDLGIDQLISTEPVGAVATMSPNRMGPPASTAHVLLGTAMLLGASRSRRARALCHLLAFLAGVIALLPLMGYAYGLSELYAVARFTGIALVTAVALLMLSMAVQAGRPDVGLAALTCRQDEVGVFARRLLPAAVVLPFGLGWLLARAMGGGLVDAAFAISAMALVLIVLLAGVIWRTGTQLVLSLDARTATERALGESERTLREADQQKTEFLATLSHELRNPLAPIRFAVELLNGPPDAAARARQTLQRQVQHLTRLIDDLLDLTRITRNKLNLHVRPSPLQSLVGDAADAVASDVERTGHELVVDVPTQPVWLQVDPDRVVQMLVNLLTNAIRYSEPRGKIVIGSSVDDADVTLFVRDRGHGIEAADLQRVFERFVQVGTSRHGGLGIGLALVKALAELHGGSVEARSDGPGHGSEFRLRLPRANVQLRETAAGAGLPPACCRILVVDDNRDAADMLSRFLTSAGHAVAVAHDGEAALRRAETFAPQICLLDIGMPGMDGYELAVRLRNDLQLSELFLVAITGWGQEEDRRRALAAGFDAHLTKPADPVAIAGLIAERFATIRGSESAPLRG
jgi:signal transduction histidine kinase/ActR/RegA family two-component response regulator